MNSEFPRVQLATDEEREALEEIKDRHQWQLGVGAITAVKYRRKGGVPYGGTVRPGVIKERRRKNKAARAARRLNRG